MARLDSLIGTLVEQQIPLAAIQPDSRVMLDMGGGDTRPLNDTEISARQVEMFLFEVMTDDELKEELRYSGRAQFIYRSPHGPADVTALRRGGKLSVYVSVAPALRAEMGDACRESEAGDEESEPANRLRRSPPGGLSKVSSGFDLEALSPSSAVVDPPDGEAAAGAGEASDDFNLTYEGEEDFDISSGGENDPLADSGLGGDSSFADASARPSAIDQSLGLESDDSHEERPIPMAEPGTSAPIDRYLRVMYDQDCSDLHLSSKNPPLYRKDGEMTKIGEMDTLSPSKVEELILPIMPDRNYEEFLEIRDTDFAYEIDGIGRFRCNIFMDRHGPGAVFRLIPDELLTVEDLGLSRDLLDLCFLNKGMVVVTGPTGSGKSTTLASMIDYINRKRRAHIITLEDPIEFVHDNKKCLVNQREIGVHTMNFSNAIRAALREDPDIVLVGEMRDLETIALAIETAETGHLVFGTLHTNTAPSTVDRIIDQFPSDEQAQIRTMLSESLRAVVSQTLCKKKGGGRVAAMEVLMVTRAISNMIREGKTFQIPSVMETKKSEGMVTMADALMELLESGQITAEEAFFNATDKPAMEKRLTQAGYQIDMESHARP